MDRVEDDVIALSEGKSETGDAKLTGGEIWEFLFSDLKGVVPEELSDDVLARLASHITEHFICSR